MAFVLGLCVANVAVVAQEEVARHGISVDANLSFGTWYKADRFASVVVDLGNSGPDQQLDVEVVGVGVTRRVRVDLASGGRKRMMLTAPAPRLGGFQVIVREAGGGDVVALKSVAMQRLNPNSALLAYVGRRPPGLKVDVDFGAVDTFGLPVETEEPQIVRVSAAELPEEWLGYEVLTALVWSHPEFDALSAAQVEALRRWVLTGGHLMVAVDDDFARVAGGPLANLLPFVPEGVEVVEDPAAMVDLLGVGPSYGISRGDDDVVKGQGQVSDGEVEVFLREHEAEVRAFYDANARRYAGAQFRLARIRVPVPAVPEPDHEWEPRRWSEVSDRLYSRNEPFDAVARELSEDPPYASRGGDMGWVFADDLPRDVASMVETMRPGDMRRHDAPDFLTMYRLDSYRTGPRPFEEVSTVIARTLLAQRLARERPGGAIGVPARLPVLQGRPRPMAEPGPQSSAAGDELTWTWAVGDGRVTLWRTGWERVARTPTSAEWRSWLDGQTHPLGNALWQIVKLDEPRLDINPLMLVAVLFVYLLVIGPVDYFVLRKLRRLEWTVFTYSGSILVFSVLAWAAMAVGQSQETRLVRLQVVTLHAPEALAGRQLDPAEGWGQGVASVRTLHGYFTSTRERLTVRPTEPLDMVWSPSLDEFMSGALLDSQTLQGRPAELSVEAAAYAMMPIERAALRQLEGEAPIQIEVAATASGVEGDVTVTNRSGWSLRHCILIHEDRLGLDPFALPVRGSATVSRFEAIIPGRPMDYSLGYSDDWSVVRPLLGDGVRITPYDPEHGMVVCIAEAPILSSDDLDIQAVEVIERAVLRVAY